MKHPFVLAGLLAVLACPTAEAQRLVRSDLYVSNSSLSAGQSDWRDVLLAASFRTSPESLAIFKVEHNERFGLADDYFELRLETTEGLRTTYVAIGAATDADFRPEVALRAGVSLPVASRWQMAGDIALSRYNTGDVADLRLGAERRWVWRDATTQAFLIVVDGDEQLSGYGARIEAQAATRLRVRLGYADAPEVSENVITEVVSWSLGAMFELNDRVALRADLTLEDRGAYERQELGLGAAWRF